MIKTYEYLGILIQGGLVVFMLFSALFFLWLAPLLRPNMKSTAKAINKSMSCMMLLHVLGYMSWIVLTLLQDECNIYGLKSQYPLITTILFYYGLMTLPMSLVFGSSIVMGSMPKARMIASIGVPYAVLMLLDILKLVPYVINITYILTIGICAFQLFWYARYAHLFEKKLLDNFSSIEGRSMKWFVRTQFPLFLLAVLYIPMTLISHSHYMPVLYDMIKLLVMLQLVIAMTVYRVDDKTEELMVEQIKEVMPENVAKKILTSTELQTAALAAEQTTKTETTPEEPNTANINESTDATAEPVKQTEAQPKERSRSFDFTEKMNKLEAEQFYLDADVNIDWITSQLGTNRHYVSDYLSQIKHMTFYEYVNSLRLEHAEKLLKEGKEKVADVAYSSGFNSDHTFRRLFKEKYGCTPMQYQKAA